MVWLSLRTSDDVDYSDPQEQSNINTFREYNEQLADVAAASDGYLQVADWATYSNGASAWFEADGVHLTPHGVDAVTRSSPARWAGCSPGRTSARPPAPWTVLVPGAEGEVVEAVQEALVRAGVDVPGGADGVYGNDTMATVAEYQRRTDGLQATGAVDLATARSLGVYAGSRGRGRRADTRWSRRQHGGLRRPDGTVPAARQAAAFDECRRRRPR